MMHAPETPRFGELALILLFLAFLVTPVIGQLTGHSGAKTVWQIEFRKATRFPSKPRTIADLAALPEGLEAWANDHFGFRGWFVALNSAAMLELGASGSDRVIIGKDGWLFQRRPHRVLEEQRGLVAIRDEEIDGWIRAMVARRDWLAARGIAFVLAIPPLKHSVYPEQLPNWATRMGPTRLDRTTARLADTDLVFVDIRRELREARSAGNAPLWYTHDTHWNARGAFIGYTAVMGGVREFFPEMPVIGQGEVDFPVDGVARKPQDLVRMLNLRRGRTLPRVGLSLQRNLHLQQVERVNRDLSRIPAGPAATEHQSLTTVASTDLVDLPSALVVRDSFTNAMAPLLRESFESTMFTHHRANTLDGLEAERFAPDVVIYCINEKAMYHQSKNIGF